MRHTCSHGCSQISPVHPGVHKQLLLFWAHWAPCRQLSHVYSQSSPNVPEKQATKVEILRLWMCYFLKVWGTFTQYTLVHCYGAIKSPFTLDYSGADKFQGPSEEKQCGEQVKGIVAGFYVFDNNTAFWLGPIQVCYNLFYHYFLMYASSCGLHLN